MANRSPGWPGVGGTSSPQLNGCAIVMPDGQLGAILQEVISPVGIMCFKLDFVWTHLLTWLVASARVLLVRGELQE